jgi:hypothetical protein
LGMYGLAFGCIWQCLKLVYHEYMSYVQTSWVTRCFSLHVFCGCCPQPQRSDIPWTPILCIDRLEPMTPMYV